MTNSATKKIEGRDTPRSQPLRSPSRLFRRLTTRFKHKTLRPKSTNLETASPPKSPTQTSTRRSAVPIASADIAAVKRRQAALQQCGLVPLPRKDLSQLEAELDRRFTRIVVIPQDQQDQDEITSAERIRREWQAKNDELGQDADQKDPSDTPSGSLQPELLENPSSTGKAEERKTPELTLSPPPGPPFSLMDPASLSPIPETFSIPDLPEEDVVAPENQKEISPTPGTVDPLTILLPDSPISSSTDLPNLPPTPPPRESKRLPPIVVNTTTNDVNETQEQVTRGRSLNRDSPQSLASRPSLPALSPTMTASSSSSIQTPRDDESRERMEAAIARSNSAKSRSSRFGQFTHARHRSEELGVVHEASHEGPEIVLVESRTYKEGNTTTTTPASPDQPVEKKRRMSTGFFRSSKRKSGSIRSSSKSTASDLSSMWNAITSDFSLKPVDGRTSRSSNLSPPLSSIDQNKGLTPTQPQTPNQSKITRSRSVMTSLGFMMTRKTARPTSSLSPSLSSTRQPTIRIVENRENIIQEIRGIEDDESRRLTEVAFDF